MRWAWSRHGARRWRKRQHHDRQTRPCSQAHLHKQAVRCWKMARAPAPKQSLIRRTLQLLVGNPCPDSCSTTPSSQQTSLPSNWQIQPRSHMVVMWRSETHTRLLPGSGSPCHGSGNTTSFWVRTIPPANLQNHQHSCMGRPALVARSAALGERLAALVAGLAELVAKLAEGTRDGGSGSTTPSCLLPKCSRHRQRS